MFIALLLRPDVLGAGCMSAEHDFAVRREKAVQHRAHSDCTRAQVIGDAKRLVRDKRYSDAYAVLKVATKLFHDDVNVCTIECDCDAGVSPCSTCAPYSSDAFCHNRWCVVDVPWPWL